jgi:predicted negative regulator of RcsB-dependent stress response
MDEELAIITNKTRGEKIINFFINNRKKLIISFLIIIILTFGFFIYLDLQNKNKTELSDRYNKATINYIKDNKDDKIKSQLIDLINEKNRTYSPLALYFIIDNEIITDKTKINELFDIIINKVSLEKEIKNLIIYKKALFNSEIINENDLIKSLNPIINSESIWKSHSLYLVAEYFYSNQQMQKAKEFYNQIIIMDNVNPNIKIEVEKRLSRDFSE